MVIENVFQLNEQEHTHDANEGFLLQDTFKNVYEEELFALIILRCKCGCFKKEKIISEKNAIVIHENGS